MLTIQRAASRSFRQFRLSEASGRLRRFAHDEHGAHGSSHQHAQTESFGGGFYFTVALIPAAVLLYSLAPADEAAREANFLTRIIKSWKERKDDLAERNALHTRMVEQAGFDKNLFVNSPSTNHHELRFPEVFNVGSPFNVPAGQGANLDKVIAHYREKGFAEEKTKLQKIRDRQTESQTRKESKIAGEDISK